MCVNPLILGCFKAKIKENEKSFKKTIDSNKYLNIIRLILKSGDQLFKCLFY